MTDWSRLPPTGYELWIYRHRTAVRVVAVALLVAVIGLATATFLSRAGLWTTVIRLAGGGGAVVMLLAARQVERSVEREDGPQRG